MPPKDAHVLISRTCDCIWLHGKGKLKLQGKFKLLISCEKRVINIDYPSEPKVITKVLKTERETEEEV